AGVYDTLSRLLLGPLIEGIAADIAAAAPAGAQVLEVGGGPGRPSRRAAPPRRREVLGGGRGTGAPVDPAGPPRVRGDQPRPGPGHDRPRPSQRRPPGQQRPAPAIVRRRRRSTPALPRRLGRT